MVIIVLFLMFIIDIFYHNARLIDDVAFTFNMLARNYGFMPNVDNFSCIVDKLGLHWYKDAAKRKGQRVKYEADSNICGSLRRIDHYTYQDTIYFFCTPLPKICQQRKLPWTLVSIIYTYQNWNWVTLWLMTSSAGWTLFRFAAMYQLICHKFFNTGGFTFRYLIAFYYHRNQTV
jgi:hypothetical protein